MLGVIDNAKACYEVPLKLLRYRYNALVEDVRKWVADNCAAIKATTTPLLKYRRHLQVGAFHEIRQIEVERLTQMSVKRSALCVPQSCKKIKNPPFVAMLKVAERKFGVDRKPSTPKKRSDRTEQHKERKSDQGR